MEMMTPAPGPDLLAALEALLAACVGEDVLAAMAGAARAAGYAGVILVQSEDRGAEGIDPVPSRLRIDLPASVAAAIDPHRLLARRELRARPEVGAELALAGTGPARLVPVPSAGAVFVFVPQGRPAPDWAEAGRGLVALASLAALCLARRRADAAPALRPRQTEVLGWVAAGKTTAEIATILGLTRGAVEKHLRLCREALEAGTTAEAIARAARAGLI
jgi:DNA-binding CsgD family transcriptional regulator